MKRLWLRLRCWWYDICFKHGQKVCGYDGLYCPKCDNEWWERKEARIDAVLAEVRKRR